MWSDRKKLTVLVCLVVFWIGLIVVQRHTGHRQQATQVASVPQGTSTERGARTTSARRNAKQRSEIPRLKLARIERVRPPFYPEGRNIFASIESPAAIRPSLPKRVAPPTLLHSDPFLEQAKKIRFLGFAEVDGKPTAFIAYEEEILVIPESEVFGSQFQVKAIKEDAIIVTSLDGTKEIQLGLSAGPGGAPPSSALQRGKRP